MGKLYNIRRFYEDDRESKVIAKGLTLEEAREWCNDPETSSYTASSPKGCGNDPKKIAKWHEKKKHWFDGFQSI